MPPSTDVGQLLLEAVLTTDRRSKTKLAVSVDRSALTVRTIKSNSNAARVDRLTFADIIGCDCRRGGEAAPSDGAGAYLVVYAYPRESGRGRTAVAGRKRRELTFRFGDAATFEENYRKAVHWKATLDCLIRNDGANQVNSIGNTSVRKDILIILTKIHS